MSRSAARPAVATGRLASSPEVGPAVVTGRLVLILARRNLVRRPGGAVLLLVAISTATLTLSLALAVGAGAGTRWDRIVSATGGAEVVATAEQVDALTPLLRATGVAGSVGPYPVIEVPAQIGGQPVRLRVVGRDTLDTAIDHPLVTAGAADLSGPGVVLDHNLAAAAGVRIGDPVRIGSAALVVRGTAVSAAQPPFPYQGPGLAWVSLPTAERLSTAAGRPTRPGYLVELRLSPGLAPADFVAARHADPDRLTLQTGPEIRANATRVPERHRLPDGDGQRAARAARRLRPGGAAGRAARRAGAADGRAPRDRSNPGPGRRGHAGRVSGGRGAGRRGRAGGGGTAGHLVRAPGQRLPRPDRRVRPVLA